MAPKTAAKEKSNTAADESRRIRIQETLGIYFIIKLVKLFVIIILFHLL